MAAAPERVHVTAATPEPVLKMAAAPERTHVMAATAEPVHKMAAKQSSVVSLLPYQSQVKLKLLFLCQVKLQLSFLKQEPLHVSSDHPEPRHISSDTPKSRPIMMASMFGPPLMSVQAANTPVASAPSNPTIKEVLPPAAALPLMAIAIWCVWAAHFAPEVLSVHKSAPEVSSVHKSASSDRESAPVPPEMMVLAADPPKGAVDTTIKSPEVAAYAAEPLEVAASTAASPVAVMLTAVSLEVAAEAVEPHETGMSVLAPCTVVVTNNPHLASVPMPGPEPATEANYELSPFPVPDSLPVLSQFMTRVLAPPWRAPAPPAPPWWAPALPTLPQSPGPPHGPGPPTLTLSRPRPSVPLDCFFRVECLEAAPWWGGSVMIPV
ncbi:hypothetical protein M9458_002821, partial [Cirrhinus mrigala]